MVSVNQVRHLFVVNEQAEALTKEGQLVVKTTKDKETLYFQYLGKGGQLTSDRIPVKSMKVNLVEADNDVTPLKQAVLTLTEEPVAGADYIVDIIVSNYIAMSDESVLVKFGAVHAVANMSKSDFYLALAKSFARNFSRDVNKFFKFYLVGDSSNTEVTPTSKHTGEFTGVKIVEQSQEANYVVGEFPLQSVNFQVIPHTILSDGDEVKPFVVKEDGSVAIVAKEAIGTDKVVSYVNGYKMADLEYFCMGERGDQYRQMGYPNTIRTKYMVIPTEGYDVIDIDFYFEGHGIDAQKSNKTLTLVVTKGTGSAIVNKINALTSQE